MVYQCQERTDPLIRRQLTLDEQLHEEYVVEIRVAVRRRQCVLAEFGPAPEPVPMLEEPVTMADMLQGPR